MKKLIILGVLIIAGVAAYFLSPSLESVVQKLVHKYGSQVTGTDVNLKGFNLSLASGEASIKGLTVANPANYKSPYIINLGGIKAKVDLKSLTTDKIIVEEIIIEKPVVTYEMLSITQNNVKQIQENVAKNTASAKAEENKAAEAPKSEKKDNAASKKVVIKLVKISGAELQALTPVQGQANSVTLKMPEITLTNIGENQKSGIGVAESIAIIFNKMLSTASQTVVNAQLGDLKNVAQENMNNVVDGVKDKVKSIGIFTK